MFDFFFGVFISFNCSACCLCTYISPFLLFDCFFGLGLVISFSSSTRVYYFLCFFFFPFFLLQCIGVAGVCMLQHGIVLLLSTWYNVAACVVVL